MKKIGFLILTLLIVGALLGCIGATTTVTTPPLVEDTIIEITTAEQLAAVEMHKNYLLMNDIDLGGVEWNPLGSGIQPYRGTFQGNNFTISNFVITTPGDGFAGLFANVSGTVENLTLEDIAIHYSTNKLAYAGGIAAFVSGDILHCHVNGTISITNTGGSTFAGLLAGNVTAPVDATTVLSDFEENIISECSTEGTVLVSGHLFVYAGGLIGKTDNTAITSCSARVLIDVTNALYRIYAGGLIGHNYGGVLKGSEADLDRSSDILIQNSFATGSMDIVSNGTGASVGGLIGYNQHGALKNDYAAMNVNVVADAAYIGGLLGEVWYGNMTNSVASLMLYLPIRDGQVIDFSGLTGHTNEADVIANSFFRIYTTTERTHASGTEVLLTSLQTASWYETTLTWNPAVMDIPTAIADLISLEE